MKDPTDKAQDLISLEGAKDELRRTCPYAQGFDEVYGQLFEAFEKEEPDDKQELKSIGFEFIIHSLDYAATSESFIWSCLLFDVIVSEYWLRNFEGQEPENSFSFNENHQT